MCTIIFGLCNVIHVFLCLFQIVVCFLKWYFQENNFRRLRTTESNNNKKAMREEHLLKLTGSRCVFFGVCINPCATNANQKNHLLTIVIITNRISWIKNSLLLPIVCTTLNPVAYFCLYSVVITMVHIVTSFSVQCLFILIEFIMLCFAVFHLAIS